MCPVDLNKETFLMSRSYIIIISAALVSTLLTSCFKDEPLNAECDIEQAWLHSDYPSETFVKPADSIATNNETARTIIFTVRKGTDITALAPMFKLTPGATISPANGSVHNFKDQAVNYTVTSEDRAWSKTYTVRFDEAEDGSLFFDFENFFLETAKSKYYIWTDLTENGTQMLNWASGNGGFAIVGGNAAPEEYPTAPCDGGVDGGHAVALTTRATGQAGAVFKMPIAAGNLFTGTFRTNSATMAPLKATHFGEGPYCVVTKKPLRFTGFYQYAPGTTVTDRQGNVVEGITDRGDIYAVLFRNTAADGKSFYLNGEDVKTSDQIVARAFVGPVDRTEDGKWQKFDIPFEYIAPLDEQTLANRGYSLAIVFTSSNEGASFQGAVGSRMLIDNVRVTVDE